ncbi:MAG: hypothetical protein Q4G45_12790 [Actinomycetia bacterium]|nr:hypothetical protein [Actinomycetes bacterium]
MSEPLPDDQPPFTPEQAAALSARLRDLYEQIGESRRQRRAWYLGKLRGALVKATDPDERERLQQAITEVEAQGDQAP